MAVKERKQITGTTAQINAYEGHEGQIVWDKEKKTLVGMSGTAGKNYPLAPKAYVDNEVAKKQPKGDYATNAKLTEGLAGKATTTALNNLKEDVSTKIQSTNVALGNKAPLNHTHAVADVADLQVALDGKLDATAKAESAKVADSANSVSWGNVTGKPSIPERPKAYITETWSRGESWYRKWSDGFIEQGGYKASARDEYQKETIAFHVSFASTNVGVQITMKSAYTGTAKVQASSASEITTTKFVTYPIASKVCPGIFWVAYGY